MKRFLNVMLLLLIFLISNGQSNPNIEIIGGEKSLKCSNDIGKMEFSSEYTFSFQEELNSYFLLNFKDSSNKKHYSICLLSKSFSKSETKSSTDEPK